MKIKNFFFKFVNFIKIHWKKLLYIFALVFCFLGAYFYIIKYNNNDSDTNTLSSYNYNNYSAFTTVRADNITYNPSFDIIPLSNISFYSYSNFFKPVSALMLCADYSTDNVVLYYPIIKNFDNSAIGYTCINLVSGLNEIIVACNSPAHNIDVVNFRVQINFNNSFSFDDFAHIFSNVDDYNYSFDIISYDNSFPSDLVGKFASVNMLDFNSFSLHIYNINYPSTTDFNVDIVNNYIDVSHFVGYYDNYYAGYNAGLSDGIIDRGLFGFLSDSVYNILSVELFPNFPLYNFLLIGVGLLTFGLLVKLFNW